MDKDRAVSTSDKRKLSSAHDSGEDDDEIVYFEEESESEPDQDCDNWDNDCEIITTKPSNSVTGYHLMPTCSRDPDENPAKKIKLSPQIRAALLSDNLKSDFQSAWNKHKEFTSGGIDLIVDPFRVCVIDSFLENPNFLNDLREEFNDIDWNFRTMDLYEFFQSKEDLKHSPEPSAINSFYKLLQGDVMKWVAELTGLHLTHISATCSLYGNTDYLLVHDDQRGDRMVAFILYLTHDWDESKGGALQLLDKDDNGQVSHTVRDIVPTNNQFVFFPVTRDSYHQVAEVTALDSCRLSINGWFHTETPPIFETPSFKPYSQGLYGDKEHKAEDFDGDLSSWLTDDYLDGDVIEQIQQHFEDNSEISLRNFLKTESFSEVSQVLECGGLSWMQIGPPNRYRYEVAVTEGLPEVLDRFLRLFKSKQMFSLLRRYTDLDLDRDKASMKFELQRWRPGCYSLLSDYRWNEKKELDLIIHFGCSNSSDVIGARTLYVSIDEEVQDALITLEPEENSLNLVYRDTARFTKYFSKLSRCRQFYTLICSYSE